MLATEGRDAVSSIKIAVYWMKVCGSPWSGTVADLLNEVSAIKLCVGRDALMYHSEVRISMRGDMSFQDTPRPVEAVTCLEAMS